MGHFIPGYVDALKSEMRLLLPGHEPASSVYFGGGTPSLMNAEQVNGLLTVIGQTIGLDNNAEITLEANPGTVSPESLNALRLAGVNRLSLGIQSFFDEELQVLGRIHTAQQAQESILEAQKAGIDNLSLDFIFGLPGQTMTSWQRNLDEAIASGVQHLSLYSLIIEPGTPFERLVETGRLILPDDDLVADMFEFAMEYLPTHGFNQYEISSWALGEKNESRHNKVYWQNQEYFGIGAGAHGKVGSYRVQNTPSIPEYINKMSTPPFETGFSPALEEKLLVDNYTAMQETMLLGLRMTREGVSDVSFQSRFNEDMEKVFAEEMSRIFDAGLVQWEHKPGGRHLRLTRKGIMFGNQAFQEFI